MEFLWIWSPGRSWHVGQVLFCICCPQLAVLGCHTQRIPEFIRLKKSQDHKVQPSTKHAHHRELTTAAAQNPPPAAGNCSCAGLECWAEPESCCRARVTLLPIPVLNPAPNPGRAPSARALLRWGVPAAGRKREGIIK